MLSDAGYKLAVVNAGCWGETCDALIYRVEKTNTVDKALAEHGHIACVLVLGGTNDILAWTPPAAIAHKLQHLHNFCASLPGAPHVGVLTIPTATSFQTMQEQSRQAVNAALRSSCQRHHPAAKQFLVDSGSIASSLCVDGLHYHGAGYVEIARRVMDAMRPLLASQQIH